MKVFIEKTGIRYPFYANKTDAGMDIIANEDVVIAPGETKIVKTGIKVAIPEGYEVQIRPRSGISAKTKLMIPNSPGTIDAGYRGEIGVIITNASRDYEWKEDLQGNKTLRPIGKDKTYNINGVALFENRPSIDGDNYSDDKHGYYVIKKGDRIAQMVLASFVTAEFEEVEDVSAIGENRGGGFGSTGTN